MTERTMSKIESADERSLRAQALEFATRVREPDDTSSGEAQLARARRYLAFLQGEAS
jgi:hypothetical protein